MLAQPKTRPRDVLMLLLLTLASIAVHGYHLGVEDQGIYLPSIKKVLDPALYPHDARFFLSQTRWTVFDELVAWSVRLAHLPLDVALLLWHVLAVFLVLLGCFQVSRRCFREPCAQWAGVALVAALETLPVAGTLVLMVDQYAHPRVLATAMALFALCATLDRRPQALLWLGGAAALHPPVAVFAAGHLFFQFWVLPELAPVTASALPALPGVSTSGAWQEIIRSRRHYYPLSWTWYEWLGVYGPILLLTWFARIGRRRQEPVLAHVAGRLALSGTLGVIASLLITTLPGLEWLVAAHPMRYLHFLYLLLFLLGGGLLGEFVLRDRAWRWALLLPICAVMFVAQSRVFPSSPHIEWPGRAPQNAWLEAFAWIRGNTPRDALFALDPRHMERPGEDFHGFRAFAERSMLAEYFKDRSVTARFPSLADDWSRQYHDRENWNAFRRDDFMRLREKYGVNWVVLEQPGVDGLPCPYANGAVRVCRVE